MRIAILGPYFWPQMYGIEKVMYAHAAHLSSRGHEVHVISSRLTFPHGMNRELPRSEKHNGFEIHRLDIALRAPPLLHYPSRGGVFIRGLGKTLGRVKPDVVHAHNIGAASWAHGGARYARSAKAAFFYSTHHHPNALRFDALRKSLTRAMNDLPVRSAAKIYHLTKSDFSIFPKDYPYASPERFAVLLNGVDPATAIRTVKPDADPLEVLFVGRVDDVRKGFSVIEGAIASLDRNVRESFRLTVVGTVSDSTRRRLETTYGGSISVRGSVSAVELERAYANADIFLMPSLYEGFGMPYIEAMRYGIPVIGSNVGGVPEVVPEGTGILTPPGDAVAVAQALERLVRNASLRSQIGIRGKAWSNNFIWETIVDGLELDYAAAVKQLQREYRGT